MLMIKNLNNKFVNNKLKKSLRIFVFIGIFLFSKSIFAQETLSLNDAIKIAIENNFNIQLVKNELEIAKNNNYPAASGYLPNISLNASTNFQSNSVNQRYSNGNVINTDGASSVINNVSLAFSFNLFDGFRMFAIQDKLDALENASKSKLQSQINNTISQLAALYSDIIRQKNNLKYNEKLIEISKQRLDLIKLKMESGLANNSDLFLVQMDLQSKIQTKTSLEIQIKDSKINLNKILKLDANKDFEVDNELKIDQINFEELESKLNNNPEILQYQSNLQASLYNIDAVKAAKYPQLKLNAGYAYNVTNNSAGFSIFNQANGPFIALNLNVPIYTFGILDHDQTNAELQAKSIEISNEMLKNEINSLFAKAKSDYISYQNLSKNEIENLKIANDYLELTLTKYKLNQATIIDLREAERSYAEVANRLSNFQYLAKISELELKRLTNSYIAN